MVVCFDSWLEAYVYDEKNHFKDEFEIVQTINGKYVLVRVHE